MIVNQRKPKIAVIGLKGLPAFGGAAAVGESVIFQLYSHYLFTVYSISSHTDSPCGDYKNVCNQIVFKSIRNKKLNSLLYYLRSAIHCLTSNYDLVHLHHKDGAFILPLLRLRYKVVLTTHGMVLTEKWMKYQLLFNISEKLFLGMANQITCVSLKDKRIVIDRLKLDNNAALKKAIYIPNGVSEIKFNDHIFEKKIVFAAGRIVPSKGCHIFLEAMLSLKLGIDIQVIGDFEQMDNYGDKLLAFKSKLENLVFSGLIRNKDVLYEEVSKSKIFVYPSVIESMSMMILEVASLGVPLILSRITENLDVFDESEALYVEPNNVDELAEKIEWALNNYNEMRNKALRAQEKLKKSFMWSSISKQYEKVYLKLLS